MSGEHESPPLSRREGRFAATAWCELFGSSLDNPISEWRCYGDVGARFQLANGMQVETGATVGATYQTTPNLGGYLTLAIPLGGRWGLLLRGQGGASWGNVSSTRSIPNGDWAYQYSQWQNQSQRYGTCLEERTRIATINDQRRAAGLRLTPEPSCAAPGPQPLRQLTQPTEQMTLGYHILAGFHLEYHLSESWALVAHGDLHYNNLIEPRVDFHGNIGVETRLGRHVLLSAGIGLDGDGSPQVMMGFSASYPESLHADDHSDDHPHEEHRSDHDDHRRRP